MKYVTALFRSHDAANAVRDDLVSQGVPADDVRIIDSASDDAMNELELPEATVADFRRGMAAGGVVVAASVDDERVEIVQGAMGGAEHRMDEDELRRLDGDDGQLIAPAGKPLGAVGATSTIGAADDGRQTYRDPMEPRD